MAQISVSRADDIIAMITTVRIVKLTAMADALSVPDGGFSVNPRTGADVASGFAVSVHPDCERVLDKTLSADDLFVYLVEMAATVSLPGRMWGGWRDPATGKTYLDVSVVTESRSDAFALARQYDQVAIFDFDACASIPVV